MDEVQSLLKQMVVPYADYASFLIDCATLDLVSKVQKLQNRGIRICKFKNMYERCSATWLQQELDVETLEKSRFSQLLYMMHKIAQKQGVTIPEDQRGTRADHKIKFNSHTYRLKTMYRSP